MQPDIRDREYLFKLKPQNIEEYLIANQWEKQELHEGFSVWSLGDSEIILPLERIPSVYPLRVSEILQELEIVENRSKLKIYRDCILSLSDVLKIRVDNDEISAGNIPIDSGLHLFKAARKIMYSSAYSLKRPSSYYRGTTHEVGEFMKRIKLGHTEEGSFIVNIVIPLVGEEEYINPTFKRNVSKRLLNSLDFINENSIDNEDIFDSAIENGVNYNLCSAISEIYSIVETQDIQLSLNKSSFLNKNDYGAIKKTLEASKLEKINEASRKLRTYVYQGTGGKQITIRDEEERLNLLTSFRGKIIGTDWKGDGEPYYVRIFNQSDKKEYIASLRSKKDFRKASNANVNQTLVKLRGKLQENQSAHVNIIDAEMY